MAIHAIPSTHQMTGTSELRACNCKVPMGARHTCSLLLAMCLSEGYLEETPEHTDEHGTCMVSHSKVAAIFARAKRLLIVNLYVSCQSSTPDSAQPGHLFSSSFFLSFIILTNYMHVTRMTKQFRGHGYVYIQTRVSIGVQTRRANV